MRKPHPDLDAVVLLATTLSSKRRPAELVEIVAAADLIQGFVPYPEKLGAAIERLAVRGLVAVAEGGFTLTDAARELMAAQPRKASQEDLIVAIERSLSAWRPRGEHPSIVLDPSQLDAAVRAHKAVRKTAGRNLLMPKPAVTRHFKVEGRWRRATKER